MSESAAAIKVLSSEEKLAEAQFKATGDAQAYAAEKSRILKEQIKQQETAVKAAEDAVKKLTENGVSPNSREMQTWQTKLNTARTRLVSMQTKLNDVESELGDQKTAVEGAKTATDNYNTSMDKVAKGVDLQNTITAIDNLKGHIEAIVTKAAQAAKAIWDMGADAGKWADDLATAAAQAGVDVETYQSWQFASRFIDTSVSDIVRSWGDIDKKLKEEGTTAENYAQAMREMGVSVTDASGKARTSTDIFWDAIEALHEMGEGTEQTNAAVRLFGNDWRNLQPLIQAGSRAYKDMADKGREVAVVSADQVAALGSVDDSIQDMNARFDKLKYESLAAMAPTFETVAQAMSTATTALNEFISSEEGQKALESLNTALSGVISSLLGEDGGKGTFEGIVTGAKDAVEKFTGALDWISQHGEVVGGIIKGMGAAWAGLTVAKEVLLFMQLLQATPLSKLSSLFGGGAAGTAGTAASAAAGNAVAKGGLLTGALNTVKSIGTTMAVPAAVVTAAVTPAILAQQQDLERARQQTMTTIERAESAAEGIGEEADAFVQMIRHGATALGVGDKTDIFGQSVLSDPAAVHAALKEAYQLNFSDVLDQETQDKLTQFWESLSNPAVEGFTDAEQFSLLQNITDQLMTSLEAMKTSGQDAGDSFAAGLNEKAETVNASAEGLGQQAATGLANGINARSGDAIRAAKDLADQVTAIMRKALDIHSPSKVFEQLGAYTGQGFALGLERSAAQVDAAAGRMLGTLGGAARRPAGMGYGVGTGFYPSGSAGAAGGPLGPSTAHITLMLDQTAVAETLVPLVDQTMGAKLNAVRR